MDALGPPSPLSFHIAPPVGFNGLMGAVPAHLERLEDFHGWNFLPGLLAHLDELSLTVTIRAVHLLDFKLGGLPDGEVEDIVERRVASCDLLVVFLDSQSSSSSTKHELTGRL